MTNDEDMSTSYANHADKDDHENQDDLAHVTDYEISIII